MRETRVNAETREIARLSLRQVPFSPDVCWPRLRTNLPKPVAHRFLLNPQVLDHARRFFSESEGFEIVGCFGSGPRMLVFMRFTP